MRNSLAEASVALALLLQPHHLGGTFGPTNVEDVERECSWPWVLFFFWTTRPLLLLRSLHSRKLRNGRLRQYWIQRISTETVLAGATNPGNANKTSTRKKFCAGRSTRPPEPRAYFFFPPLFPEPTGFRLEPRLMPVLGNVPGSSSSFFSSASISFPGSSPVSISSSLFGISSS